MNDILTALAEQARGVAADVEENTVAKADKRSAAAQLLSGVVDAVRPALRAMSSRIVIARVSSGAGKTERTLDEPGVYLASLHAPVPLTPGPQVMAGTWQGTDLFLTRDGSFAMLSYDGVHEAGGVSQWEAAIVELRVEDVVEMFPLAVTLDAIARALTAQVGSNLGRRTKQIEEQAERLRALASLTRSL